MAALLLLVAGLPLWFPWVLRPLVGLGGSRYATYQREGYTHFTLRDLHYTTESVQLQAEHVRAVVPTVWLWRCLADRKTTQPWLQVTGWHLESKSSGKSGSSTHQDPQDWAQRLAYLDRWLPVAVFSNGTVRAQGRTIEFPALTWSHRDLRAELAVPQLVPQAVLDLDATQPSPYRLTLRSAPLHLDSAIQIYTRTNLLDLQGTASWWSNRLQFQAQFAPGETLPQKASLEARQFQFPGRLAKLPEYQEISGALSAKWDGRAFAVDLSASGRPVPKQADWPPLRAELHAHGDTNSVTIASATFSAPWLQATLSNELGLSFKGPRLLQPATVWLTADLSRQPWMALQGSLKGEADLTPAAGAYPTARFHLSGSAVGNATLKAKQFEVDGGLNWPWLQLTRAEALFEDGSTASAGARMNIQTRTVDDGRASLEGPLLRRWLPPDCSYKTLSFAGDFHGPLKAIVHQGKVSVTGFTSPRVRPLDLTADWQGANLALSRAEASVSAGRSTLLAKGAMETSGAKTNFLLSTLSLRTHDQPALDLEHPCIVTLDRTHPSKPQWFTTTPFDWSGTAGQIRAQGRVSWPAEGALSASIEGLHSGLLADFLKADLGSIELHKLAASAAWTNGPADFGLEFSATAFNLLRSPGLPEAKPGVNGTPVPGPLMLQLRLSGNRDGLALSNLVVNGPTSTVAVAHGSLPLTFNPADPANLVRLDEKAPLRFDLTAEPNAFFWNEFAARSGVALSDPHLRVALTGNWTRPQGTLRLRAGRIRLEKGPKPMPTLDDLKVDLTIDREQARVAQCQVLVQGQPVNLTGQLPLGDQAWSALKEKQLPNLEPATARLQIEGAQLAPFADLYPEYLSPQGDLAANISLLPGGKLRGQLMLHGARTRPISSLGPIRDININMNFLDRRIELGGATAAIGGAPIVLQGTADWGQSGWLKGGLPPFQFTLRGTNVPLSRQPESIVRSDLNLILQKTNGAPPLISGEARLRDSFYLSDLRLLAPGKVTTPAKRPPYFSIDQGLLADWRLNVHVLGERFMKVRSPVFNGEVSANLRLQGTLKEPVGLGDVKIDSGAVRFPFATMQIQQGLVTLTSRDPYRPELAISAASKQFGYDIKMDVTGSASAPVIQFSSTPPLSSEQILLMVTTGQVSTEHQVFTTAQRAQALAVFLGRDVLAKLGLADQAEERLTVQSGEDVTLQGKPTYRVEYRLSKRWSLVGEYDRFNDLDVGLKWRVYSK